MMGKETGNWILVLLACLVVFGVAPVTVGVYGGVFGKAYGLALIAIALLSIVTIGKQIQLKL